MYEYLGINANMMIMKVNVLELCSMLRLHNRFSLRHTWSPRHHKLCGFLLGSVHPPCNPACLPRLWLALADQWHSVRLGF